MTESSLQNVEAPRIARPLLIAWLIVGWLWAGVPLAAGVYFSVAKSLPLFKTHVPAEPGK